MSASVTGSELDDDGDDEAAELAAFFADPDFFPLFALGAGDGEREDEGEEADCRGSRTPAHRGTNKQAGSEHSRSAYCVLRVSI